MEPRTLPGHVRVLVVGAGFGGLAMAIKLTEAGEHDYLVVERGSDVGSLEPRAEVQRRFVDGVQARIRRTVWSTGGCASWYLDSHGRNVTLWPRATFTFRRMLAAFDPEAYELVARGEHRLQQRPEGADIESPAAVREAVSA